MDHMTTKSAPGRRWNWASFVDSLNSSVMVGLLMPDGTLMHANQTALEVVGAKLRDVAGMPYDRTPWWAHSEAARERLRAALEAGRRGEPSRFDTSIRTVDGRTITVDFALCPVFDEAGKVGFLVASACDVTERHRAEERASYVCGHDVLTGLPNRHGLQQRLEALRGEAQQAAHVPALLSVDIDHFSRINAALGNAAADAVLRAAAHRVAACLPDDALLARFDSDELVVVLLGADARAQVQEIAAAILDAIAPGIEVGDQEVFITASIGIAVAQAAGADVERLLRHGAIALDRAKQRGRNTWALHDAGRDEPDPERFALEAALRHAIARDELELVYQPQVEIASGNVIGVEALLRWEHPVHGSVSPAQFIPIAEEAGLIGAIGDWVLEQACRTAARWQREGLPPVRMNVNVSVLQLRQGDLAARVEAVLARTGLDAQRLGIEVTETVLVEHLSDAAQQLGRLRSLGVEISLDDFGTGYSSLSYLRRLPLDVIKIDRSLVPAVTGDSDALPITRAIIAMAHSLGMKVTAEGVENESQLELLAANHCDFFQGYHFSAPQPVEVIETMLRAGRKAPLLGRRNAARSRTIVVVDDERLVVEKLRQELPWRFGDQVTVHAFVDPREALRFLHETSVDIIASDLRMPGLDGIALMSEARALQPDAVRLMLLGPTDMARVIEDRRQVDVFRYLPKPWVREQLLAHFQAALDKVEQRRADDWLLAQAAATSSGLRMDTRLLELLHLEEMEPGITAVARGPLGEVLLPSRMMTLPGDLWSTGLLDKAAAGR